VAVRAITPLVEPHGLVLSNPAQDSDALGYDAWRDALAVPDPYELDFEPVYSHGLVLPPEASPPEPSAAIPANGTSHKPLAG
jgi:hypothetical protein